MRRDKYETNGGVEVHSPAIPLYLKGPRVGPPTHVSKKLIS